MKKALAIILLLTVLLLSACNCNTTKQVPSTGAATQVTEATETHPTETTMMPENTTEAANNSFSQPVTEPSETTGPTVPEETSKPTTPTEPKEETPKDPPPTTKPTEETQPSTTEPETQPTEPQQTEPTNPPTEPTEPETEVTTPPASEEAVCKHEWKCIHHSEEGHWRAGIICDCGWTVYGDPDSLTALWNAHSASFPAAESLFDHGGFGSMDEWIVDKPAYDEWVCRHCGEPKP